MQAKVVANHAHEAEMLGTKGLRLAYGRELVGSRQCRFRSYLSRGLSRGGGAFLNETLRREIGSICSSEATGGLSAARLARAEADGKISRLSGNHFRRFGPATIGSSAARRRTSTADTIRKGSASNKPVSEMEYLAS